MTGTLKLPRGLRRARAGDARDVREPRDEVKKAMGPDVAAIDRGACSRAKGAHVPAAARLPLPGLRALCDESGALFLLDEVQTGLGRLGRFLGIEGQGIQADMIAPAKGLGGGFPDRRHAHDREVRRGAPRRGRTARPFGGNPLSERSGAGRAQDHRRREARRRGESEGRGARQDAGRCSSRPSPRCARARGARVLLRGLVLKKGFVARDILPKVQENGVLLTAAGESVLRFSPPLVVSIGELEEGVRAVRLVCEELAAGGRGSTTMTASKVV